MPRYPALAETDFGFVSLELARVGDRKIPIIHCTITRWTPGIFRQCCEIWRQCLQQIADMGFTTAYAQVPMQDLKLNKFIRLFGMQWIGTEKGQQCYRVRTCQIWGQQKSQQ